MKYVFSVFTFVAGYAMARVLLEHFGLSPVVQLLGGAAFGYAAAQPVWSYYARRDAEAAVRGIFGSVAEGDLAAGDVERNSSSAEVQAAPQVVTSRLRPTTCPSCRSPYERKPETTFLGFQRFKCTECLLTTRGPLKVGYRVLYWASIFSAAALATAGAFHGENLRSHPLSVVIFVMGVAAAFVDAKALLMPRQRRTLLG